MKIFFTLMLFLCTHFTLAMPMAEQQNNEQNTTQSTNTLIIFYDTNIGKLPLEEAINAYHAEIIYEYQNFNGFAIRIPESKTLEQAKAFFSEVKGVLSVEADQRMQLH